MKTAPLFRSYELLVDKADAAFRQMEEDSGACIKCERHCSDCCHAVFGLFLIEAAYLKQYFDQLEGREIREALFRCSDTERALKRLEIKLQTHEDEPQMQAYIMARERIRCPLLDENQDCILYTYRPITCRVYGIPTKIHGKARVCGKAGFKSGESYPVFDLDGIYRELYILSKELLNSSDVGDPNKADFLISSPKAIGTPLEHLINETFSDLEIISRQ